LQPITGKYQRFHPNQVNYVSEDTVDTNYYDPKIVMSYYEAVELLNGYVISQWSMNRIDVRHPKKDNVTIQSAVKEYNKRLGQVKYYEAILQQSTAYKAKGLSNEEIQIKERNQLTEQALQEYKQKQEFYTLFEKKVLTRALKKGDQGPWVYELQKNLNAQGYAVRIDGRFREETHNALKDFENKNQLYPDGKLDVLTLRKLLPPSITETKPLLAIQ